MTDRDTNAKAALATLKRWDWCFYSPDGDVSFRNVSLSLAINRMAMEGVKRPGDALLCLLCNGDALAYGNYRWRKYEAGQHYGLEGTHTLIDTSRWKSLWDLKQWELRELATESFGLESANLEKLGLGNCYPFDIEYQSSRFSIALCPPDTSIYDPNYFEEWYSVSDIVIMLAEFDDVEQPFLPELEIDEAKKGGRPRKWDWDGALLHLAAIAHHDNDGLLRADGGDPNQSDIADHLREWFIDQTGDAPSDSQLRGYGARFVAELNALKLRAANKS